MANPANKAKTGKRKASPSAWKPGQSGNPKGRPPTGESWGELIKKIGDLTPTEAAKACKAIAGQLAAIGNDVTLKEAVVLRVYASLLFEPQPGLLNIFIDRAEGKVADKLVLTDWRKEAQDAGIDPDELTAQLFAKVKQASE